jgi:hypothetical protein
MSKHILFKANILDARYDSEIHGERTILIVDPDFLWPQIEQQNYEYDPETSFDGPTILIDDPDITPPMIEVLNPLCKIPADAIEVSDEIFYKTINEQDGIWSLVDGEIMKLPFPPPTQEQLQAKINADARAYLASTDWYVVRFAETGVAIPVDIAAARQEARNAIV